MFIGERLNKLKANIARWYSKLKFSKYNLNLIFTQPNNLYKFNDIISLYIIKCN